MIGDRQNSVINALDLAILFLVLLSVSLRPIVCGVGARYTFLGLVEAPVANLLVSLPFLFAFLLWVCRIALRARLRLTRTDMGILIMIFLVFVVRAVFVSEYQWRSAMTALDWIGQILLFLLLANAFDNRRRIRLVMGCLAASAVVVALYGLHQRFVGFPELLARYRLDPVGTARCAGVALEDMEDFRSRMETLRVSSTFVLPTTLAGFFVLVLPSQIGLFADHAADAWKRRSLAEPMTIGLGAAILLQMIVLFLTKSKGGWITLALGLGLFAAIWGRSFLRRYASRRKKAVALCVGLFVLLFALAQWCGKLPPASRYVDSLLVRSQYWRAGVEMIEDHPLSGIGLNEFGDVYTSYKRPQDDETQMAHNNFIQVWAEMGLFGFLSFCGIWLMFLIRYFRLGCIPHPMENDPIRSHALSPIPREREPAVIGIVAGVIAVGLGVFYFFSLPVGLVGVALLLLGWVGGFLLVFYSEGALGLMARRGIWIGVVCFLIHSLVDFDLYEPGVAQTLWTLAAMGMASAYSRRILVKPLTTADRLLLAGGALAAAIVSVWCMWPPILAGGVHLANAHALVEEKEPNWKEAVSEFRKAAELAPGNASPQEWLGVIFKDMWNNQVLLFDGEPTFELAVMRFERAVELNPRKARYHFELAELYRSGASDKNMQERAAQEYEKAVRYYPAKPLYLAQLGSMYDELKKPRPVIDEAFRRALYMDDHAIRRNKLPEEMRRKIEAKLRG